VNAGCTGPLPAWLDELAIGGRLLVPLTVDLPAYPGVGAGRMLLVTRRDAHYDAHFVSPVGIFHCEGARSERGNVSLAQALARGDLHAVHRLRRDAHEQGENCWLHGESFCLQADPALRTPARTAVAVGPELLRNYVGNYQLTPDLVLSITLEGDALFAQAGAQRKLAILPESQQKFFYPVMDAQITFVAEAGQAARELILHQVGSDIRAPRVA
jgi:hypothetical protein